ncbi:MAG TPA: hypothetical protein VKR06_10755 [Ktedonosporobacter sp.]|nr:hypothetical protein [Ktedonosporobacter sp.]
MFRRRQQEPTIPSSQETSTGDDLSVPGNLAANNLQRNGDTSQTQAGRTDQWRVGATPPEQMARHSSGSLTLAPTVINNQQLVLITQLMQITTTMRHVNELFLWLARALVQRLGVQVVQFWTNQEVGLNPHALELQRMACQSNLLPQHIVVNEQVTQLVRYIAEQHIPSVRQSVSNIFSHQQATILKHYGLNYCVSYVLRSNTWYASANHPSAAGQIPAPLLVVALLFFQHPPSQRLHVSIEHILEQGLLAARNRGLLQSSAPVDTEQRRTTAPVVATPPLRITGQTPALRANTISAPLSPENIANRPLAELVPKRIDDIHLMTSSNPLANSVDIPDRQIRRLYVAIDGHKNLTELSLATRLTMSELKLALQTLIKEQRIRLHHPEGQPMDDTQSLDDL